MEKINKYNFFLGNMINLLEIIDIMSGLSSVQLKIYTQISYI